MNSSLEVTTHQTEETSDMISSLRTYFKELNRKMVDVAENVKRLGCNVCQLENRVRDEFMLNLLLIKQPIRTEKIWFMILPLFFFVCQFCCGCHWVILVSN